MAGPIKIAILADSSAATRAFKETSQSADKMGDSIGKSGSTVSDSFDKLGKSAVGLNAVIDTASGALESIDSVMNASANNSRRLARAQLDVEQAMADGEQAAIDLRQATQDLNQAEIDGSQSKVDYKQAQIDAKQANLDATIAQKAYNKAVKENGKGSEEARQAAIDLSQAKADLSQAEVDAKQATADGKQATIDSSQALTDGKQATIDAKTAVLDLGDAQRELNPSLVQQAMAGFQTLAPAVGLAAIAVQTFGNAAAIATIKTTVMSGATKAAAGAQALLNAALVANPIGLVIAALVLLGAGLVIAYKKSETFRRIVDAAFGAVKRAAETAFNWVRNNWPRIKAIISVPVNAAKTLIVGYVRVYIAIFRTSYTVIKGVASRIGTALRTIGTVINAVRGTVRTAVGNMVTALGRIISYVRQIPGKVRSAFSNFGNLLVSAGQDLIRGLWRGISSMGGYLTSNISGFISRNVTGKVKGILGINSPSKVAKEFGKFFGQGLGIGIVGEKRTVARASGVLANAAAVGLDTPSFTTASLSGGSRSVSSGPATLEVRGDGSALGELLVQVLQRQVRIKGGNVQKVLGAA